MQLLLYISSRSPCLNVVIFFFSSRRRHTRFDCDWSSDVCSSDLPNPYGHKPLVDNDPTKPDVKDGTQNDYWDHVDYIVNKAEKLGLTVGFLPTWGDKWNPKWAQNSKIIFNAENAAIYGEWLGKRYKDKPIIWILGGDRPIESDESKEMIRAMARGL